MKNKRILVLFFGFIFFLTAPLLIAGTKATDIIRMENKAYSSHTKGIVEFTHKKHVEQYKEGCGECHHDENNKPLANLKEGDNVQGCIECHKIPSEKPKGKDAPKLTKEQSLEYHAEAIHENCRECHKKYNKEKGLKATDAGYAPISCQKCHPKKK